MDSSGVWQNAGVVGELSAHELDTLKEYISGQASDGWGEGFEQREISVDGGELYVHLWNSDDWSIQTEKELFAPRIAKGLPELCFSTLLTTGQLICIKRGETGYYPSDWDTGDKEKNVELADQLNEEMGVTMWQRKAMEVGSMCGWDVPGADPKAYEQEPMGHDAQLGGAELDYQKKAFEVEISNGGPRGYETAITLKLPATWAEFHDALQKARIPDGRNCGIELTRSWWAGLSSELIGGAQNLYELNLFAMRLTMLTSVELLSMDGC